MKSITVQIAENGTIPITEHNNALRQLLRDFSEKEVTITISELTPFSILIDEAVTLQNKFSEDVSNKERTWTNEEVAVLRSKIASAYFQLGDYFAAAKSDEKNAFTNAARVLSELKIKYMKEGDTPTYAASRAKIASEYTQIEDDYLVCYQIRVKIEIILDSMNVTMNAISGVQKVDASRLRF
jgi:hypothetical protein